ncbi:MAG: hypothetical protein V3V91_04505 [Thermoplasmata archaeon]
MRLEDYEDKTSEEIQEITAEYDPARRQFERGLELPTGEEEKGPQTFSNRVCAVVIVVSVIFIVAVLGFVAFTPTSENENETPPPTEGRISFWLYCDDIYVCPFNVYVKGEGVPDPNFLGWDWMRCDDDYVDCYYYSGSYDFFGGTLMLDPGSTFAMEITLPFGSYDYQIKIAQTVEKSGFVYLSEQDHREIVSYHYYG